MNGYHEVRSFTVPLIELDKGWAAPENFKPFAVVINHEEVMGEVICRRWHRGEDHVAAAYPSEAETSSFDADDKETIEAHEWPFLSSP